MPKKQVDKAAMHSIYINWLRGEPAWHVVDLLNLAVLGYVEQISMN